MYRQQDMAFADALEYLHAQLTLAFSTEDIQEGVQGVLREAGAGVDRPVSVTALRCRTSDRTPGASEGAEALALALDPDARVIGTPEHRIANWDADLRDSRACIERAGEIVDEALADGRFPVLTASDCSICLTTFSAVGQARPGRAGRVVRRARGLQHARDDAERLPGRDVPGRVRRAVGLGLRARAGAGARVRRRHPRPGPRRVGAAAARRRPLRPVLRPPGPRRARPVDHAGAVRRARRAGAGRAARRAGVARERRRRRGHRVRGRAASRTWRRSCGSCCRDRRRRGSAPARRARRERPGRRRRPRRRSTASRGSWPRSCTSPSRCSRSSPTTARCSRARSASATRARRRSRTRSAATSWTPARRWRWSTPACTRACATTPRSRTSGSSPTSGCR